jgi:hypothetical protein
MTDEPVCMLENDHKYDDRDEKQYPADDRCLDKLHPARLPVEYHCRTPAKAV